MKIYRYKYIYTYIYVCIYVYMYMILNNQYYIWWLCKKWKKFNPKGFSNIILIRKWRTIIFLWRAYKLLLWIVYNTMHEKMLSYLNIYKMKWFDLYAFLLNPCVS